MADPLKMHFAYSKGLIIIGKLENHFYNFFGIRKIRLSCLIVGNVYVCIFRAIASQ